MRGFIPSDICEFKKNIREYFLKEFNYDIDQDWSTKISDFEEFEIPYLKSIISKISNVPEDKIIISCSSERLGYHGSASDKYLKIYYLEYSGFAGESSEIQKIKYDIFPLILRDD